jgi:voltage-gated potassium channel
MKSAIIFGYNEYTLQIAHALQDTHRDVALYVMEDELQAARQSGLSVYEFDLTDDWSQLEEKYDIGELTIFCVLQDSAQNIFLTISLRSIFEDVLIIALSQNQESERKLKSAGANKTISITQTTANIITEMIERPFVTKILNDILYGGNTLKIAEIEITNQSPIIGIKIADIEWKKEYGVIVLAVVKRDFTTSFIYTKTANQEPLAAEETLIVIGSDDDISAFETKIGRRKNVDWHHWSR